MRAVLLALAWALLGLVPSAMGTEDASRLELIERRGRLVVGVKADYPPWGQIDAATELVGLEPDLAADIARRLVVGLELVAVTSANRLQRLEDGAVDLVIATMADTPQRRALAGLIEPHYYASGVNVLSPASARLTAWEQLRGRRVCLTDGAYFNRTLVERYGIVPQPYKGTRDSQLALRDGRCTAWAYDDTALIGELRQPRWQGYEMALPSIEIRPWAVAVKKSERDTAYGRFVADTVADWHRSGLLIERVRAWGLTPSEFLMRLHGLWSREGDDGGYYCARDAGGAFPPSCLAPPGAGLAPPLQATGFAAFLTQDLGVDFSPVYDAFDRDLLLAGIGRTLLLGLLAIAGSLLFGLAVAVLELSSPAPLRIPLVAVVGVFRMTPPILHLYILFFGLGSLAVSRYGWAPGAFTVATTAFSLYAGAANAAILARAYETLGTRPGTLGVSATLALLPAAVDRAYEGLVANCVNIVKAAGMASTIAVPEVIWATRSIIAERGNGAEMMNFLLVFYLCLVSLCLYLLRRARLTLDRCKPTR